MQLFTSNEMTSASMGQAAISPPNESDSSSQMDLIDKSSKIKGADFFKFMASDDKEKKNRWVSDFERWSNYRKQHGTSDNPENNVDEDLVRWVREQRESYASVKRGASAFLEVDGYQLLERMGFMFDDGKNGEAQNSATRQEQNLQHGKDKDHEEIETKGSDETSPVISKRACGGTVKEAQDSKHVQQENEQHVSGNPPGESCEEVEDMAMKTGSEASTGKSVEISTAEATDPRTWAMNYLKLAAYHVQHGSLAGVFASPELGRWAELILSQYEKFITKKPNSLTQDRVLQLEALGDPFEPTYRSQEYSVSATPSKRTASISEGVIADQALSSEAMGDESEPTIGQSREDLITTQQANKSKPSIPEETEKQDEVLSSEVHLDPAEPIDQSQEDSASAKLRKSSDKAVDQVRSSEEPVNSGRVKPSRSKTPVPAGHGKRSSAARRITRSASKRGSPNLDNEDYATANPNKLKRRSCVKEIADFLPPPRVHSESSISELENQDVQKLRSPKKRSLEEVSNDNVETTSEKSSSSGRIVSTSTERTRTLRATRARRLPTDRVESKEDFVDEENANREYARTNVRVLRRLIPPEEEEGLDEAIETEFSELLKPDEPLEVDKANGVNYFMARSNKAWERNFRSLLRFKKIYGHTMVPKLYHKDSGLSKFVSNNRKWKKMYDAEQDCPMTASRLARLEAIQFVWDAKKNPDFWKAQYDCQGSWDLWLKMLQTLVEYKKVHGDCLVPKYYPKDQVLARWVTRQRHHYRQKQRGKYHTMSEQREKMLLDIGFVFNTKNKATRRRNLFMRYAGRWDAMYEKMLKYKEKFGHTVVPRRWKDDQQLASWVQRQRYQYKLKTAGKYNYLTDYRLKKLEDIDFVFCRGYQKEVKKELADEIEDIYDIDEKKLKESRFLQGRRYDSELDTEEERQKQRKRKAAARRKKTQADLSSTDDDSEDDGESIGSQEDSDTEIEEEEEFDNKVTERTAKSPRLKERARGAEKRNEPIKVAISSTGMKMVGHRRRIDNKETTNDGKEPSKKRPTRARPLPMARKLRSRSSENSNGTDDIKESERIHGEEEDLNSYKSNDADSAESSPSTKGEEESEHEMDRDEFHDDSANVEDQKLILDTQMETPNEVGEEVRSNAAVETEATKVETVDTNEPSPIHSLPSLSTTYRNARKTGSEIISVYGPKLVVAPVQKAAWTCCTCKKNEFGSFVEACAHEARCSGFPLLHAKYKVSNAMKIKN